MKRSKGYLHGFTPEEQDRLRRQARIIENLVHEHRLPFQRSRRLLEIGCGVGAQTEILLRHFPELHVTGLDASKTNLDKAREFLSSSDWQTLVRDFGVQGQPDIKFLNEYHFHKVR